jgi:hypothetical protein
MAWALVFDRATAVKSIAARIPMMPMTTSNSTSVNPRRRFLIGNSQVICAAVEMFIKGRHHPLASLPNRLMVTVYLYANDEDVKTLRVVV